MQGAKLNIMDSYDCHCPFLAWRMVDLRRVSKEERREINLQDKVAGKVVLNSIAYLRRLKY